VKTAILIVAIATLSACTLPSTQTTTLPQQPVDIPLAPVAPVTPEGTAVPLVPRAPIANT
jgi:hypothetical protein